MANDQTKSELKQDLRRKAIQQRSQIAAHSSDIDSLIKLFEEHIQIDAGQIVSGYWPINGEVDVMAFIELLNKANARYCLPVMKKDDLMLDFYIIDDATKFRRVDFGIQEPVIEDSKLCVIPDIVIVPLLAFDRIGTRLGYGGGYYDKTLSQLKKQKDIVTVGLAYDQQICLFPLPREDHDIPMDWVITPSKAYHFTN